MLIIQISNSKLRYTRSLSVIKRFMKSTTAPRKVSDEAFAQ